MKYTKINLRSLVYNFYYYALGGWFFNLILYGLIKLGNKFKKDKLELIPTGKKSMIIVSPSNLDLLVGRIISSCLNFCIGRKETILSVVMDIRKTPSGPDFENRDEFKVEELNKIIGSEKDEEMLLKFMEDFIGNQQIPTPEDLAEDSVFNSNPIRTKNKNELKGNLPKKGVFTSGVSLKWLSERTIVEPGILDNFNDKFKLHCEKALKRFPIRLLALMVKCIIRENDNTDGINLNPRYSRALVYLFVQRFWSMPQDSQETVVNYLMPRLLDKIKQKVKAPKLFFKNIDYLFDEKKAKRRRNSISMAREKNVIQAIKRRLSFPKTRTKRSLSDPEKPNINNIKPGGDHAQKLSNTTRFVRESEEISLPQQNGNSLHTPKTKRSKYKFLKQFSKPNFKKNDSVNFKFFKIFQKSPIEQIVKNPVENDRINADSYNNFTGVSANEGEK